MAFTFPTHINCKAGAVHPGNDFYVPTRKQESESLIGAIQTIKPVGTVMQIPNNTYKEVTIIALDNNTGDIYVECSNVSASDYGVKLGMKESITLRFSNTNVVYITSSVSGEDVSYVVV